MTVEKMPVTHSICAWYAVNLAERIAPIDASGIYRHQTTVSAALAMMMVKDTAPDFCFLQADQGDDPDGYLTFGFVIRPSTADALPGAVDGDRHPGQHMRR
jgi:hypothetical protein